METKKSLKLITSIILLLSCFLFSNCEKEEILTNSAQIRQEKILDVTIAHWHSFEIGNRKAANSVGKFRKKHQSSKNSESSEYGFFIDDQQVQIIENENYTTFTFLVIRDQPEEGVLENYMYKEFADGNYQQFLLKYYYSIDAFGNHIYDTDSMDVELINDEGLIINRTTASGSGDCQPHLEQVESGQTCIFYERCTGPANHEVGDSVCGCTGLNGCFPAGLVCEQNYTYTFVGCSGDGTGGDGDITNPNDPDNPPIGGGGGGDGSSSDDDSNSTDATPFNIDIRLGEFIESLSSENLAWWNDINNHLLRENIETVLQLNDFSDVSELWAVGQIELEILAGDYNWISSVGKIANLEYTHVDHRGNGSYFKLADDSVVFASNEEQTLTSTGELTSRYRDNANIDFNERYYYIQLPGHEWAEMLFDPDNLADALETMFLLGAQDLGIIFGRYIFPVEDIKILISGTDFDGEQVSRWQAAGFLALSVIPGGKAFRVIDDVVDATKIAIKLQGGTHVVDLVSTGLKIAEDSTTGVIRFLDNLGNEVARIVDGIMTFVYNGFGGNIITTPNKTTTVIGKWIDNVNGGGTKDIIESGLSRSGSNIGGINALSETPDPDWGAQEIWDYINEPWLDDAIQYSDVIRVISDPMNKINVFSNLDGIPDSVFTSTSIFSNFMQNLNQQQLNQLSFYGREIRHLFLNGYTYDVATKTFIP